MHQHARRGRALLTRVGEGRGDDAGDGLVEVRVAVDDHAVLAAHLGDDVLEMVLTRRSPGRRLEDLEAHRRGPCEGDRVDVRVADERGAGRTLAGKQRERVGRHAGLAQRGHQLERAGRRLLGGLEHDRVARRQRGRGHARGNGEREVPR